MRDPYWSSVGKSTHPWGWYCTRSQTPRDAASVSWDRGRLAAAKWREETGRGRLGSIGTVSACGIDALCNTQYHLVARERWRERYYQSVKSPCIVCTVCLWMIGRIACCRWRQSDLRRRADWGAVGRDDGALFLLRRQNSDHPPGSQVGWQRPCTALFPLTPSAFLHPPSLSLLPRPFPNPRSPLQPFHIHPPPFSLPIPFPLIPLPTPYSLPSSPAPSLNLALPFTPSTSIPLPFFSPFPSPSLNPFPLLPLPTPSSLPSSPPSSPTLSLTYPLPFTPSTSIPISLCLPLPFPLPLALPPSHLPSPSLRSPLFSQLNRLQTRFTVFSVSSRYTIKAGGYVSGNVKSPYLIIPAARIHIHPNYRMRRNANDFALVKLSRPIKFNKFIRPVCLPSIRGERPADVALPGNSGYFASPSSAKVFLSRRKGEAESFVQLALKISSNRDCRNKTRQAFNASGKFCAGRRTAEKHSCRGDGGGPFVQREQRGRNAREMRWVLSGILSWNEECGARGRHGYFTRVAQYVAWVRGMTTRGKSSRNSKRRSRVWACDQFQISPAASPVI